MLLQPFYLNKGGEHRFISLSEILLPITKIAQRFHAWWFCTLDPNGKSPQGHRCPNEYVEP